MKRMVIPEPKEIYRNLKASAKRRNIEFTLSILDIYLLDIPITCPLLGIPLYWTKGKATDNTPSVDRIDSSLGYVDGNIEIISIRANRAKNNLTIEEIIKMALYYE